jgi:endonuclease/exonuclease/phosphatase family metal-dependent hydrolase
MSFWKNYLSHHKGQNKSMTQLSQSYKKCLKVMTWNVLARMATKHNAEEHAYQPVGIKGTEEHIEQTMKRFEIILSDIIKSDMDILFLQEVDYNLFYYLQKYISKDYNIFFNSVQDYRFTDQSETFGTAVLWKKKRFVVKKTIETNSKDNKYSYKNCNAVLLYDKNTKKTFYCLSIHLSGKNMETNNLLLKDTFKKIDKKYPFIISGDFNCSFVLTDCLQNYKLLKDLDTFQFKKKDISTCNFDFNNKNKEALIDSIFFSQFSGITYKIGKSNCKLSLYNNKKPYSNIKLGSDHFWIQGLIQFL